MLMPSCISVVALRKESFDHNVEDLYFSASSKKYATSIFFDINVLRHVFFIPPLCESIDKKAQPNL